MYLAVNISVDDCVETSVQAFSNGVPAGAQAAVAESLGILAGQVVEALRDIREKATEPAECPGAVVLPPPPACAENAGPAQSARMAPPPVAIELPVNSVPTPEPEPTPEMNTAGVTPLATPEPPADWRKTASNEVVAAAADPHVLPKVRDLLKDMGAVRLADLPDERLPEFVEGLQALTGRTL